MTTNKHKSHSRSLEKVNGIAAACTSEDEYYPGQELEGKFGWFGFTPGWLQFFNNPKGFLFMFSVFLLTQGMLVNGIFNVIISTLERRFGFQSSETGLIAVSYDIGYFILVLFVTFYANRGHRPRLLAIGSMFMGLGSLMFAIPHFTTGLYEYEGEITDLCAEGKPDVCLKNNTGSDMDNNEENLHDYLYLFIFAMILQGIGCVPLYTISYAILEDSLPKSKSPIYISIGNAMSLLGPVIGYILGGYMLTIYVDFDDANATGGDQLTPSDPRWVGAWWIGHVLAAVMCFTLVTIPMFGFPQQFPGSAKVRAERESEVHANAGGEVTEQPDFGKTIKDMPTAIFTLLKNPTYAFTVLGGCSEAFVISGFTAFLPKIIENNYNATPATAALYAGVIGIPGGIVGNVISGFLVSKYKLRTPQLLKLCMFCVFAVFLLSPIGLYHCSDPVIAGVTTPYNASESTPSPSNLSYYCNNHCECSDEYFAPVCANDVSYFTACHAGCSVENTSTGVTVYSDCACIMNTTTNETGSATSGLCEDPCDAIIVFILVFFVIVMISFMLSTPGQLVILRCVPDSQRSFSIGLQVFALRALGSIPGPIVFGSIFDTTCALWQEKDCGEGKGSCYVYSSKWLALDLMTVAMSLKATSTLLFYLALRFYKLPEESKNEDDISFSVSDGIEKNGGLKAETIKPEDVQSTQL